MKIKDKVLLLFVLFITGSVNTFSQQIPDSLLKYMETAAGNNPSVLQRFTEYQPLLKKYLRPGLFLIPGWTWESS
jgi:hypothetical protein